MKGVDKGPILVTGANGFLGSHIVRQLLRGGYSVHAAVRNAASPSAAHLSALPEAGELLRLFGYGDLAETTPSSFAEALKGCVGVIHVATPVLLSSKDGENAIYKPAMASTQALLEAIEACEGTVHCLVLTSSTSAMAPRPEPPVKDESHWSDSGAQKARGNWYGAAKTDQERLVTDWHARKGKALALRFASICPTMIVGPNLCEAKEVSGTMAGLRSWVRGSKPHAPNDSMSFIHVEDCAAHHVAALERGEGRYMSVVESLHWNDIARLLQELLPNMVPIKPYTGPGALAQPTQFNHSRMRSLGVEVRSVRETLTDALAYLDRIGAL